MADEIWPALPFAEWQGTAETLQLWTQIVGKVRLALTPWMNHSWHVTLYLTARGLTTSPISCGTDVFEIDFDFVEHALYLVSSARGERRIALRPRPVADFYREVMKALAELKIEVAIDRMPNELPDPIRLDEDETHRDYDSAAANRFWRILLQTDRVFKTFRARFIGKCSPVHFFWGSFDLAVTRFSGREAPPHPGGVPHLPDVVAREAYSHEVSSAGFWPGNRPMPEPVFYSYAYPAPTKFEEAVVRPRAARWNATMREYVLPYEAVRTSPSPDETLLEFLQSTYEAAATLAGWDRDALEHRGPWPR